MPGRSSGSGPTKLELALRRLLVNRTLKSPPSVMSSPPAITVSAASAAISLSNGVLITPDRADAFTYFGGAPAWAGSSAPLNTAYWGFSVTHQFNTCDGWGCEFFTLAPDIEIRMRGNSKFRLLVDDQLVSAASTDMAASGSFYYVKVALGASALRRIRLEMDPASIFGGVAVDRRYPIWGATDSPRIQSLWVGDSFTSGTTSDPSGVTLPCGGYIFTACRALGWQDIRGLGVGSTGYIAAPANYFSFYGRRQDLLTAPIPPANGMSETLKPDVIIVAGGINDASANTKAAIKAAAVEFFDFIRSKYPNVPVFVHGGWVSAGDISAGTVAAVTLSTRDALQEASAGRRGFYFIDNIAERWMMGSTGTAGTPTTSGYADLIRGVDTVHPTILGHQYYGMRFAEAINRVLKAA